MSDAFDRSVARSGFSYLNEDEQSVDIGAIFTEEPKMAKPTVSEQIARDIQEGVFPAKSAETLREEAGDPDMTDLSLCSFEYLATELRKRGATVTPAPHGGDYEKR